jgi:hypothetical protein
MVDLYDIFFHFAFIASIAVLLFVLIGSFIGKFGEKHFKIRKRYFPFLLYPRNERSYSIVYKLLVMFALVFMIIIYMLFLWFNRS